MKATQIVASVFIPGVASPYDNERVIRTGIVHARAVHQKMVRERRAYIDELKKQHNGLDRIPAEDKKHLAVVDRNISVIGQSFNERISRKSFDALFQV